MTSTTLARPAPPTTALAERIIDLGAIARNVGRVRAAAAVPLMAVVKADAFGHGAVPVAHTVLAAGASSLGVATIPEALELRRAGISAPILAWLLDEHAPLREAVAMQVALSCDSVAVVHAVAAAARSTGVRATVHLELDTGMSRGGASRDEWRAVCATAARAERAGLLRVAGLWSHLALAADPRAASVERPLARLAEQCAVARDEGLAAVPRHIANSAAVFAHPEAHLDGVRVGAALFGIETVNGRTIGLEQAVRVESRVLRVRSVAAGTGVGYGHSWVAPRDTTLALVPVGYGDGVPRELAQGGTVTINGVACPVRGVVSMDQLVAEVPPAVAAGDPVVLLGAGEGEPSVADWAALAGTVPHDILVGLGRRMPRRTLPAGHAS